MIAFELLKENISTIAFGLPGHGESEVDGTSLTIDNCLTDFKCIIEYVQDKYKDVKIDIFATSYGGYLTLLLNRLNIEPEYVILRCPAIKTDEMFINEILREEKSKFENRGYTIVEYERELKANYSFYKELENNKILDTYKKDYSKILIIHRAQDTATPIADTITFANKFKIPLKVVKGADHRFKKSGELEQVIQHTVNFIKDKI